MMLEMCLCCYWHDGWMFFGSVLHVVDRYWSYDVAIVRVQIQSLKGKVEVVATSSVRPKALFHARVKSS